MSKLRILEYGDRRLSQSLPELTQWDKNSHKTVQIMSEFLSRTPNAAGLAANQIGATERLFIYRDDDNSKHVVINPIIISQENKRYMIEGCLSFPDITTFVLRPAKVFVKYISFPDLEEVEEEITGFKAQIFSHETDHLNGIVMTDHLGKEIQDEIFRTLRNNRARNLRRR